MSQYKTLVIIVLIALLGGIGLAVWDAQRSAPDPQQIEDPAESPQMVGSNVSFVVTEGEVKKWKVEAVRAIYNDTRTEAEMEEIKGEFYNPEGKVVMNFTAPKGHYTNENNKIMLTGGVVATSTSEEGGELRAPSMTWNAKSKDVHATGGIRMIFPQGVSTADSCRFTLDFSRMSMQGNVTTEVTQQ